MFAGRTPRRSSGLRSHPPRPAPRRYVKEILTIGCSVLMSDIDVVYLQNPFRFLHHDADIEGTTDGWDDGSAYGWLETLDDPSLGLAGRFRPAMRITAWNSGLWYARATAASLRLMSILSHRMATEDKTWDQAAFGEEVARPARDDHLAAGITKRALNHWCFCNSKTVFRRIRVEPRFADHVPVVVHANYHQPKEPRMRAVYDRWHLGQKDALDRFTGEQAFTLPAPELEKDFLHSINDGFVGGGSTPAAAAAAANGCKPLPSKHGLSLALHALPRTPCPAAATVCAAAAAAAVTPRGGVRPEVLLVMGGSAQLDELTLMLASARRASVANLLLVLTDAEAAAAIAALPDAPRKHEGGGGAGGAGAGPRYVVHEVAPGTLGPTLAKWAVLEEVLSSGLGVLFATPATVLLSNPFAALYRDADIEAMSSGWDDGSAYGYNHVLDDPSMGFTRFCHGSRIVAYEPGFFFASPTPEAVALTVRMRAQLKRTLGAQPAAPAVLPREREAFLQELWLPSHHEFAAVGAVLRVMNYLCFANSKVLFRQIRMQRDAARPVAVQINYHSDAAARMKALVARYWDGEKAALAALPLADDGPDSADAAAAPSCERAFGGDGREADPALAADLIERSPFAWAGIGDMHFKAGGELETPWGAGKWGGLGGRWISADFVGSKHNVNFLPTGLGVSTRCGDRNTVLVRSIKASKAAK